MQEFIIPKTFQSALYRFYRNERNVYRAECIINKKSVHNDPTLQSVFSSIYQNCFESEPKAHKPEFTELTKSSNDFALAAATHPLRAHF